MHSMDVCYVCGHRGITEIAYTRPNHSTSGGQSTSSKIPCFPSLLLISPASSSKPPSPIDGHVQLCLLCWRLLLEQWKSYEERKTPMANRQYWLKCCSANRDPNNVTAASKSSTRRSRTSGIDDDGRSSSPDTVSEEAPRDLLSIRSSITTSTKPIESTNARDKLTSSSVEGTLGQRNETLMESICIVCSRGIESLNTCRRLPAHLVAQIVDVKPSLGQNSDRETSNGEALVCDDCFASPAFQSAWLDCCRRGSQSQQSASTLHSLSTPTGDHEVERPGPVPLSGNDLLLQALMNRAKNPNLTEAQKQWFALYERALLQCHLSGQMDPILLSQLQQLAAAEALASLQHSSNGNSASSSNVPT